MPRDSSGEAKLETLSICLASLAEHQQRSILLVNFLSEQDPADAAIALRRILVLGLCRRDYKAKLVLETAMLVLARLEWPKEHRAETCLAALAASDRLTSILTSVTHIDFDRDNDKTFAVPDYTGARPLTLGERRTLASRPDRKLLEKAIQDPHPMVIAKLLDNPRLTEDDVVFIAARRPAPPEALKIVGTHPRWRLSHRVARALVYNPRIQTTIGLSLLPALDTRDLAEIARDESFNPTLKAAASEISALISSGCGLID